MWGIKYLTSLIFLTALISSAIASTNVINQGGDVFLGEDGLDLSNAVPFPFDAVAYFPAGSNIRSTAPEEIVKINDNGFSASPSLYSGLTGPWYQWNSALASPGNIAFYLRVPKVEIRVLDKNTMNVISGGTISKGTPLLFQANTNMASVKNRPYYNQATDGVFDILVNTPSGGTLSSIPTKYRGEYQLTRLTPDNNPDYFPDINSGGFDTDSEYSVLSKNSGIYIITPRVTLNNIDSNLAGTEYLKEIRGTELMIGSGNVALTGDTTVTRGNSFSVKITGSPGIPVYIWVSSSVSGERGDQPPMILFAQDGVVQDSPDGPYNIGYTTVQSEGGKQILSLVPAQPYNGVKYYAMVTPDNNGVRTVEFKTSEATRDGRYSIHIEGMKASGSQKATDSIDVTVKKGSVSLSSGGSSWTMGEEIRLSGINSGSCDTYLFITGPNLPSAGGSLERPFDEVQNNNPYSFTKAEGDCETWDYKFRTGNLGLDAGTYTIFAVSAPVDKNHLADNAYETISLNLKRPTVQVKQGPSTIAAGDPLYITGTSKGNSGNVAIWIFGKNKVYYNTVSVESDGYFEYKLSGAITESLISGDYFIIVQHPMHNGEFNIWPDGARELVLGSYPYYGAPQFRIAGPGALDSSSAASALLTALQSPYIDDTYSTIDVRILSPKITLESNRFVQYYNEPVIISGTTNLAVDDRLLIEITDNSFAPSSKNSYSSSDGYSQTVEVYSENDGTRAFTLTIPAGRLKTGEYRIFVQAVTLSATDSGLLTVTAEPRSTITPVLTQVVTPVVTKTASGPTTNGSISVLKTQSPANVSAIVPLSNSGNISVLKTIESVSPTNLEKNGTIITNDGKISPIITEEPKTTTATHQDEGMVIVIPQNVLPFLLVGTGIVTGLLIAGIIVALRSRKIKTESENKDEDNEKTGDNFEDNDEK